MAKFNSELLTQYCHPSVDGIEELVFFHIVLWIQSFLLELFSYGFRNIQMWRVLRKISNKESTFLPKRNSFPYATGFVYTGIIQNQYGLLFYIERKTFEEINDYIGIDALLCHHTHIFTLSVDKFQYIDLVCLLNRNMYIFFVKLPAVGSISLRTDMRLISVVEIKFSGLTQKFKF